MQPNRVQLVLLWETVKIGCKRMFDASPLVHLMMNHDRVMFYIGWHGGSELMLFFSEFTDQMRLHTRTCQP